MSLTLTSHSYAQSLAELDYPSFQSPEAYSLGKYGDIPVSLYTGIPDISIPLYALTDEEVSVPISLSYHAGGIRVEEKASWVGLGWALNAGGVITRTVVDEADDNPDAARSEFNVDAIGSYHSRVLHDDAFWNNPHSDSLRLADSDYREFDSEPDIFFYNFLGYTGQFFLPEKPQSGTPIALTSSHSKIKIVPEFNNNDYIYRWSVVDENGIKYEFDAKDEHVSDQFSIYDGTSFRDNYTSWYLSEIEFRNGEKIIFDYSQPRDVSYYNKSYSAIILDDSTAQDAISEVLSHHKVVKLERIRSKNFTLDFVTATNPDRFDSPKYIADSDTLEKQEYSLSEIILWKKHDSGSDSSIVKKYSFDYGYFNNTVQHQLDNSWSVSSPDIWKRLRLDSVSIVSEYDTLLQKYSFEYDEDRFNYRRYNMQTGQYENTGYYVTFPRYSSFVCHYNSTPLPLDYHKLLCDDRPVVDHWGFFNAQWENNGSGIPYFYSSADGSPLPPANLEVNESAVKSGMLTKITYPTGGYAEFEYESNSYGHIDVHTVTEKLAGGLRIASIKTYDGTGSPATQKSYDYSITGGASSGVLVQQPLYIEPFFEDSVYGDNRIAIAGKSHFPLGANNGGIVGYSEVRENHGLNNIFGYTVSYFTTAKDYPNQPEEFDVLGENRVRPGLPGGSALTAFNLSLVYYNTGLNMGLIIDTTTAYNWSFGKRTLYNHKRGKLTRSLTYDNSDRLLASVTNTYWFSGDQLIPGDFNHKFVRGLSTINRTYMRQTIIWPQPEFTRENYDQTYWVKYHNIISWDWLKEQVNTTYDPVTGDSSTTKEEYFYDDPDLTLPTSKKMTNSDGEFYTEYYTYAHEQYPMMADSNMFSQVYSVHVEDDSANVLSKQWTEWTNSSLISPGSKWRPWKQWQWKEGNPAAAPDLSNAVKTAEVTNYDQWGNLLGIEDANGSVTNFYYGSNTYPFQNATIPSNAVNGILGTYLTGIQQQNGTSIDVISGGVRPGGGNDLFTEASYDIYGRLESIADENGQVTKYGYDEFSRLGSQTNQHGNTISGFSYAYSSSLNGGSYSVSSPNFVESITYTTSDGFKEPTAAGGMSKWGGDSEYNVSIDGQKSMRVGYDNSGWDGFRRYYYWTNGLAKADIMISSDVTSGIAHPFYIMTSDGYHNFTLRYQSDTNKFYAGEKHNNVWDPYVELDIIVEKGKWYTVEIEKSKNLTEAILYVYPKGSGRDYAVTYEGTGFPSGWLTRIQSSGGLNGEGYYVANMYRGESIKNVSYLDGLGRETQTQARGGGKAIVSGTRYDSQGLVEATTRPFEQSGVTGFVTPDLFEGTTGTFDPASLGLGSNSPVEAYYDQFGLGADTDYAFHYNQYENSPLARIQKNTLPGYNHRISAGKEIETRYGLNTTETFSINGTTWGTSELSKTVTEDPDGKESITYTDGWGRTIVSGINMNPTSDDALDDASDLITKFEYDERDNLVRVEDPRGLVTTYTYNALNQLVGKQLPDQTHPHTYIYDDKGRLRFHRDPNLDAGSDHFYYTKYDELDRPVEVGKRDLSSGFTTSDANNASFPTSGNTPYINYYYDGNNAYSGHTPNNTNGRLTRATYADPNSIYSGHKWYSYNDLGLVEWVIQAPAEPTSAKNVKIEYSYDEVGRLSRMYFNPITTSADDHYFWYYYDELGRLQKVTSYGSNAESSALTEAEYTYFADGQVEQLILGGGAQTVDYDYTVQGWVDQINNPSSMGSDAFAADLYYDNLNGNISRMRWEQAAFSTATFNYHYEYDFANRLKKACYDTNGDCTSTGDYDVTYSYEKNGNLTYISRNGDSSNPDIDYHLGYVAGTNKVESVLVDGVSSATETYSHDASGNVTANGIQGITSTTYDWRNLPTQVSANSNTIRYIYDADGNRVRKDVVGGEEIWYIRGADGQTVAAYDGSGNLLFLNILANGQIIGQIEN